MEFSPDTFASVLAAIQGVLASIGAAIHSGLQFLGALKDYLGCGLGRAYLMSPVWAIVVRALSDGPPGLCDFNW